MKVISLIMVSIGFPVASLMMFLLFIANDDSTRGAIITDFGPGSLLLVMGLSLLGVGALKQRLTSS